MSYIRVVTVHRKNFGLDAMDRIDLAQYRDKWRVIVNAVMKLPSP